MLSTTWRLFRGNNCYLVMEPEAEAPEDEQSEDASQREEPGYLVRPAPVVVTPLDEILATTVGRARVGAMISNNAALQRHGLNEALAILDPAQPPPAWLAGVRSDPEGPPWVHKRYKEHMDQLEACGLLQPVSLKDASIRFYSGYFAVPKTAQTSRSIFSGNRLSQCCPVPPTVNLISASELIRLMRQHGTRWKGEYHVVTGDLRHWFHQISAPSWLRPLFGLKTGSKAGPKTGPKIDEKRYMWTSLPMGWSWSPVLAQFPGIPRQAGGAATRGSGLQKWHGPTEMGPDQVTRWLRHGLLRQLSRRHA